MSSSARGYWSRSYELLTRDEGWFKPLLVLSAAKLVPIVGPFGADGYGLEWARLTAWGVDSSPKQKNVDVSGCIKSGARAFVVALGCGLAIGLVRFLLGLLLGETLGGLVGAPIVFIGSVLIMVAKLRSAIYQTIGAGFQVERIADMVRRDHKGFLRVVGLALVLSTAVGLLAGMLYGAVLVAKMGSLVREIIEYEYYGYSDEMMLLSAFMTALGSAMPALFVVTYLIGIATSFVGLILITAIGLWMRQFDVRNWGESSDPLPTGAPTSAGGYGTSSAAQYVPSQGYGSAASSVPIEVPTTTGVATDDHVASFPIPMPVEQASESNWDNTATGYDKTPESWLEVGEKTTVETRPAGAAEPDQPVSAATNIALPTIDVPAEDGGDAMPAEQAWSEEPVEADQAGVAEPEVGLLADPDAFELVTDEDDVQAAIESLDQVNDLEPEAEDELEPRADALEVTSDVRTFSLSEAEDDTDPVISETPELTADEHKTQEQVIAQMEAAIKAADMSAAPEGALDATLAAPVPVEVPTFALDVPEVEEPREEKRSSKERIVEVIDLTGGDADSASWPDAGERRDE